MEFGQQRDGRWLCRCHKELKAYLRSTLSGVIIRNPAITLDSWIDDITIECQGKDEKHVKTVTNTSVQDLRQSVETEVLLEFAGLKLLGG